MTRHAAALLAVLLLAGTDAAAGPFTANGTQPGLAHPLSAGSNCLFCHGDYDAAHDIEPMPTWRGTMMAQASRDPLFWAALDVANNDLPGIGEWCLRCHSPIAWLNGRAAPPGGSTDGCALAGKIDEPNNDFDGVSCHFCHRLQVNLTPPPGQVPLYFDNAQYWLDDGDCGGLGEPCRHGPYDYPADGGLMPAHPWKHSDYIESSEVCAVCHNVTNPVKNLIVAGTDMGMRFPIERTYREWQLSAFGFAPAAGADFRTCQQCHMPDALVNPAYASSFGVNNHSGDLPIHEFVGGNAWIPEVLRGAYPNLAIDASLQATRDRALVMLQDLSATVDVTAPGDVAPGGTLMASVKVTNLSGHKLPTGYPEGRRMWLHVEARDGAGTLVFESGAWDPATGVLADDPQLKVYESKQGVWDAGAGECVVEEGGAEQFHFVLNDCIAVDNRIPPKGFTGGNDLQTQPVGHTYPEVAPGVLAHWDVTSYDIPVPPAAVSPITVTATLRYQTTSKEYIDFLVGEADTHGFPDDCIERTTGFPGQSRAHVLLDLWQTYDKAPPVDMAAGAAATVVTEGKSFLCYRSRTTAGTPSAAASGMTLVDDLGAGTFDARKPTLLCATVTGTGDPNARLVGHPLKSTLGAPKPPPHLDVTVEDEHGTLELDAMKPESLALPAAPGVGPAPAGEDFTCWKVKRTRGAAAFAAGTMETAGSALTVPAKTFVLKKPRRLCIATDRDGNGHATPPPALLCYAVKPATGEPKHVAAFGLPLTEELGLFTLAATADAELCVPATVTP
jgi:hypothetical protein